MLPLNPTVNLICYYRTDYSALQILYFAFKPGTNSFLPYRFVFVLGGICTRLFQVFSNRNLQWHSPIYNDANIAHFATFATHVVGISDVQIATIYQFSTWQPPKYRIPVMKKIPYFMHFVTLLEHIFASFIPILF